MTTTELSASTRAGILDAAWHIASRQGPSAVSVKDVAAAAGVSRQLVYFHWAHLVGLRGWDPAVFTDRLVSSLLADLVIS